MSFKKPGRSKLVPLNPLSIYVPANFKSGCSSMNFSTSICCTTKVSSVSFPPFSTDNRIYAPVSIRFSQFSIILLLTASTFLFLLLFLAIAIPPSILLENNSSSSALSDIHAHLLNLKQLFYLPTF